MSTISIEVAQFLRDLLADQTVRVGNPDAQAAVYMSVRALEELDSLIAHHTQAATEIRQAQHYSNPDGSLIVHEEDDDG